MSLVLTVVLLDPMVVDKEGVLPVLSVMLPVDTEPVLDGIEEESVTEVEAVAMFVVVVVIVLPLEVLMLELPTPYVEVVVRAEVEVDWLMVITVLEVIVSVECSEVPDVEREEEREAEEVKEVDGRLLVKGMEEDAEHPLRTVTVEVTTEVQLPPQTVTVTGSGC